MGGRDPRLLRDQCDNFYPPEDFRSDRLPDHSCRGEHTNAIEAYDSSLKLLQMFGAKSFRCHEQALMKVAHFP